MKQQYPRRIIQPIHAMLVTDTDRTVHLKNLGGFVHTKAKSWGISIDRAINCQLYGDKKKDNIEKKIDDI